MQPGDAVVALYLLLALGAFALREGRKEGWIKIMRNISIQKSKMDKEK